MSNEQILKLIKDTELNLKVLKAHFTPKEKPKVSKKEFLKERQKNRLRKPTK
jgi:hypothetical protein